MHKLFEGQQTYRYFAQYMWSFVDHKPIQNSYRSLDEVPAKTALSDQISLSLKNHGFKFVGSTIVYTSASNRLGQ